MRPRVVEGIGTLVLFTVGAGAAAGLQVASAVLPRDGATTPATAVALGLLAVGTGAALGHLRQPRRAHLAASNLASSWLSREVVLASLFGASLALRLVTDLRAVGIVAAVLGLLFVHAVTQVYRLRTVPAWDSWATPAAFFGTALVLGAALYSVVLAVAGDRTVVCGLAYLAACAALVGVALTRLHLRRLERRGGAAAASAKTVLTEHGTLWSLRVAATVAGAVALVAVACAGHGGTQAWWLVLPAALLLASELLGRHLFYAAHRRVGL